MAGEPKETMDIPHPPDPKERQPIDETGIELNTFSIDKLNGENARYWFYAMESQLKIQFSWQAVEFYQEVGKETYDQIRNQNVKWLKIDMKADMIIQQGLSPTTILEIKHLKNVGLKWDYLKATYLESSNAKKAMQLMKMANWSQGPAPRSAKEAFREINQLGEELIDMNNSEMVDIRELIMIWYLRGLGSEYATLRDTVMSSNATLDKEYVLGRVEDLMEMRELAGEKGSRANNDGKKKKKEFKCYVCGRPGHFARECRNKHVDVDDEDQKTPKGRGEGQRGKSSTKQKGRFAGGTKRQ